MKRSAGVLLFRRGPGTLEVLRAHPGGPFFRNKDHGSWSIPKGLVEDGEDLETTARREFAEETGAELPASRVIPLGEVEQKGGKIVTAFAVEGDFDPECLDSNSFTLEWPPRSGRQADFPEIDRAEWFDLVAGAERINPAQAQFLVRLSESLLASEGG